MRSDDPSETTTALSNCTIAQLIALSFNSASAKTSATATEISPYHVFVARGLARAVSVSDRGGVVQGAANYQECLEGAGSCHLRHAEV